VQLCLQLHWQLIKFSQVEKSLLDVFYPFDPFHPPTVFKLGQPKHQWPTETSAGTGTRSRLFSTAVVILCLFCLGQSVRLEENISWAPSRTLVSLAAAVGAPFPPLPRKFGGKNIQMSPKSGLAHQPQTRNKGNTAPTWAHTLPHLFT